MAENNVIDSLELKVRSDANSAIANLGKLQTQLRHTAKDVGSLQAAVNRLTGLESTFKKLGQIDISNFISQLERLSKIDLSNFKGKTFDFKFSLSGADEVIRKKQAIQKALESVDTKSLSKKFADSLALSKGDAKKLESVFQQALTDVANGGSAGKAFANWYNDLGKSGASVLKASWTESISQIKAEYDNLVAYLRKVKIKPPSGEKLTKQNMEDYGLTAVDRSRYFSANGKSIDGIMGDMLDPKSGMTNLLQGMERVIGDEEQIIELFSRMKQARDLLAGGKTIKVFDLDAQKQAGFYEDAFRGITEQAQKVETSFSSAFNAEMAKSADKIPLNVDIDAERIRQQINNVIKEASQKTYNFPLNINIEGADLKQQIENVVSGLDVSGLGSVTTNLQEISQNIASMKGVNIKDNGLTTFVNSLKRLAEVDPSNVGTVSASVNEMLGSMVALSNINLKENGINSFVNSLKRFSEIKDAGAATAVFSRLRILVSEIKGMGDISASVNLLVSSLAKLATAGSKMATTTASMREFGDALRTMITQLQGLGSVDASIIHLIDGLSNLASAGSKAGSAARSVGKAVGNVNKSLESVGKGSSSSSVSGRLGAILSVMRSITDVFKNGAIHIARGAMRIFNPLKLIGGLANSIRNTARSILSMIAALAGFHGITSLTETLKESIALGADLTEIDHIVESVFGNMAGYVDTWAKDAIEKFGIAEHSAKRYAGTLSSMFQASNIGYMDAGKMSMDLVGLAGDLSAFYNIDTETAYEKIRSGMAGMVRPLRDLGIDLTAATLEEYRLSQGIETSYSQMTQAEKVMLRYKYLMSATTTQQGDFQRTSLSLANSMRTLKAYVQAVQTQIGAGLGSALRHVIVWMNTLMKGVLKAAQAFSTFMQTIFGKYKGGASGIAMEGLGDAADYAEDFSDATDNAADGLGNAAENAKQLAKDLSVLPFDELNQLNKDRQETSSSNGKGGSGAGGVGGGLTDGLLDWDNLLEDSDAGKIPQWISRWGKRIREAFEEQDWNRLGKEIADGINTGVKKLYDALDPDKVRKKVFPFIDAFTTSFNSFVKNLNFEMIGRTIGRGINDIVMILDRGITGIKWDQLGTKLAQGATGLIDEIDFKGLGNMMGSGFMILWDTLYGFVSNFGWGRLGEQLANGMNGFFERVSFSRIESALATGLNGAFESLSSFTETFDWQGLVDNVTNGITTFLNEFKWRENGEKLGDFLSHLCDALTDAVDRVDWEGFGEGLALALQKIPWGKLLKTAAHTLIKVFGGLLKGMGATPAGEFARAIVAGIVTFKIGSKLSPFVNSICVALTKKSSMDLVSNAIGKLVNGGLKNLSTSTLGATAAFAGFLTAMLQAGEEIEQWQDHARGGNGMLTAMGTAVNALSSELVMSNQLTAEQADELFRLKESAEESGASTSEVAAIIAGKMNEWGVSADAAKLAVDRLTASGHSQTEEFQALSQAFDSFDDNVKVAAGSIDMSSVSMSEGFKAIDDALYEMMTNATDASVDYGLILKEFEKTQGSVATAQDAYTTAKNIVEQYGGSVEDLNRILGEDYPIATEQLVTSTTNATDSVTSAEQTLAQVTEDTTNRRKTVWQEWGDFLQNSVNRGVEAIKSETEAIEASSRAEALENWQNNVQTFRDGVLQNLKDIGAGWGTLNSEQESTLASLNQNLIESINSQTTAQKNMHDLYEMMADSNRTDLDDATVQAILDQVDPSSQAMTELIQHMQAQDSEWDTFHDNIQTNLDLQADLEKTADKFATDFAKEYAPAFVKIGEDFEVEGGKIGKFAIDGVAGGVYDNADDAIDACRDTAEDMQRKWKETDQSHSPSKVYEEFGKNQILGLVQGLMLNKQKVIEAMQNVAKGIRDAVKDLPDELKTTGEKVGSGFADGLKKGLETISETLSDTKSALKTELGEIDLYDTGEGIGVTFKNGLKTELGHSIDAVDSFKNDLSNSLSGMSLFSSGYTIGQSIGNGVAAGVSSIHIPLPYLSISYMQFELMGFSFSLPQFSINWYRKGGLFMGGNGQIVGIGEDNRDEAVLPLEDRKAMARIGSAIADAGGTGGGMSDESIDKLATRIAEVIMASQDTRDNDVPIYTEVSIDSEVIARAVTKGQRSLDYRNNPVAQVAY